MSPNPGLGTDWNVHTKQQLGPIKAGCWKVLLSSWFTWLLGGWSEGRTENEIQSPQCSERLLEVITVLWDQHLQLATWNGYIYDTFPQETSALRRQCTCLWAFIMSGGVHGNVSGYKLIQLQNDSNGTVLLNRLSEIQALKPHPLFLRTLSWRLQRPFN